MWGRFFQRLITPPLRGVNCIVDYEFEGNSFTDELIRNHSGKDSQENYVFFIL